MKDKIKKVWSDVSVAWMSFTQFVEASSLATAAAFTLYGAFKFERENWVFYPLVFASAVIVLRAAHEYWKHFTRK